MAIFDRPPTNLKNKFNRPNKFLLDRVDRVSEISKALSLSLSLYIYIYIYTVNCIFFFCRMLH